MPSVASHLQELVARRAAGTAVLELHHFRHIHQLASDTSLPFASQTVLDELRVDVNCRHVIDDHTNFEAPLIVQNLLQQRCFARAQKAG